MLRKFKLFIFSFAFVVTAHCWAMSMEERHQMELNKNLIDFARQGNAKGVRGSLERGAEPNAVIGDTSALIEAVRAGKNLATIIDLVGAGVDINLKINNHSPLEVAVASDNSKMVRALLEHGARVGDDYESLKQLTNNPIILEEIGQAYIKELSEQLRTRQEAIERVEASEKYVQEYLKKEFGK